MKMKTTVLAVRFFFVGGFLPVASGVMYSLRHLYTAMFIDTTFQGYMETDMVDDAVIGRYDSGTGIKVLTQSWMDTHEWMQKHMDSIISSEKSRRNEQTFKANIQSIARRFQHTAGVHVLQEMSGCQWDDASGHLSYYDRFGYDGEDFLSLNVTNMRWIAHVPQALPDKDKRNRNRFELQKRKDYLSLNCTRWLMELVLHGNLTLRRKVPPEVSVFLNHSSPSSVVCHATGFYPEAVNITWKRDGEEVLKDMDVGETLPNHDGTFQKRVVLTVSLEERKKSQYTCEVLNANGEPIIKILTEKEPPRGNPPWGIIVGSTILLIILVMTGVVIVRRIKDNSTRLYNHPSNGIWAHYNPGLSNGISQSLSATGSLGIREIEFRDKES